MSQLLSNQPIFQSKDARAVSFLAHFKAFSFPLLFQLLFAKTISSWCFLSALIIISFMSEIKTMPEIPTKKYFKYLGGFRRHI